MAERGRFSGGSRVGVGVREALFQTGRGCRRFLYGSLQSGARMVMGDGGRAVFTEEVRAQTRSRSVWSAEKRFLMRQNGSVGRQRRGQTR
jgi:hypothetical protein